MTVDAVDPALPLAADESVVWTGRPQWTTLIPAVGPWIGIAITGAILVGVDQLLFGGLLVAIGGGSAGMRLLRYRHRQYAITDRALYHKHGNLRRQVTRTRHVTVQNSAYKQGLAGSLLGYGTVSFEIAGGGDIAFRGVSDPQQIRGLADQTVGTDGLTGKDTDTSIPGSAAQWRALHAELQTIRTHLETEEET